MRSIGPPFRPHCPSIWSSFRPIWPFIWFMPDSVTDQLLVYCSDFLINVYDTSGIFHCQNLEELCFRLFNASSINDLQRLSPTTDALKLHMMRAAYQAGWIWGSCLKTNCQLPEPTDWGWTKDGVMLLPIWTTIPVLDYNKLFFKCSCRTNVCTHCKCKKSELNCMPFCKCLKKCSN